MSVVYYVMDSDDLLISTMAERAKAKAIARTREASVCVRDEKWPLTYLQVYGPAAVEESFKTTVDVMMKVAKIMSGQALPEAARPLVEAEAKASEERRVVIRLKPQWTCIRPRFTFTQVTTVRRCSMALPNRWHGASKGQRDPQLLTIPLLPRNFRHRVRVV
jgi:hypothetical protein